MATGSKFSEENWKSVSYRKTPVPEKSFTDSSLYNRVPLQRAARIPYQETAFQREERQEREREEAERKKREEESQFNDFNFPSLTSSFTPLPQPSKPAGKSFASMARDWKEIAEENRKLQEQREFDQEFKRQQRNLFAAPPPTSFGTYRSSAADTYEEYAEAEKPVEEWTTVQRKVRVAKPSLVPTRPVEEEDVWASSEQEEWNAHLYRDE